MFGRLLGRFTDKDSATDPSTPAGGEAQSKPAQSSTPKPIPQPVPASAQPKAQTPAAPAPAQAKAAASTTSAQTKATAPSAQSKPSSTASASSKPGGAATAQSKPAGSATAPAAAPSQEKLNSDLIAAAKAGNVGTVQGLLSAGASAAATDKDGWAPFHHACKEGHLAVAQLLISHGANKDLLTSKANSALMLAAQFNRIDCVKYLLSIGVDVTKCLGDGMNALHQACQRGHIGIVIVLIQNGADKDVAAKNGNTPLYLAAQANSKECVEYLLFAGADASKANKDGWTALHRASNDGFASIVELLLQRGVDKEPINGKGNTPLALAAFNGHVACAQHLLNARADLQRPNKDGTAPVHNAASQGHLPMLQFLVRSGADKDAVNEKGNTPLLLACFFGHVECVEYLLNAGANVNIASKLGMLPMHNAATQGHLPVLQLLVQRGLEKNASSAKGNSPIILASLRGHKDCVEYLLSQGVDLNSANPDGASLLHCAATNGHLPIVQLLLARGVNKDIATAKGSTAFSLACAGGHIELVNYFLSIGCEVNPANKELARALHSACKGGHREVAEIVVRAGADKEALSNKGNTPLMIACEGGHVECAEYLLSQGVNIHQVNEESVSALHAAAKEGNLEMIEFLLGRGANRHSVTKEGKTAAALAREGEHIECAELLESTLLKSNKVPTPPAPPSSSPPDATVKAKASPQPIAGESNKELELKSGPLSTANLDDVSVEELCRLLDSWNLHDLVKGFRSQDIDGAMLSSMNLSTPEELAKELEQDWNIVFPKKAQVKLFHKRLMTSFPEAFGLSPTSVLSPTSPIASRFVCNGAAITVTESVSNRVSLGFFLDTKNRSTACVVKHVSVSSTRDSAAVSLVREIDMLRALNNAHNRAVVELYFAYTGGPQHHQQELYFVMENIGATLTSALVYDCPKHTCETLTAKLVQCMETLHSAGFMHGDIKPQNILYRHVANDYEVKFCDFDSAARVDRNELFPFEGNQFKYTAEFTCPEFLTGFPFSGVPGQLKASCAIDYFAMGLVIWQLLNTRSQPLLGGLSPAELRSRFSNADEWESRLQSLRYATTMVPFIVKLCKLNAADRVVDHAILHRSFGGVTSLHQQLDTAQAEISFLRDALLSLGEKIDGFTDTVGDVVGASLGAALRGNDDGEGSMLDIMRNLVAESNTQLAAAISSNQQQQAKDIVLQLQESIGQSFLNCAPADGSGGPMVVAYDAYGAVLNTKLNEVLECMRTNNSHAHETAASLLQSMQKLESDLTEVKQDIKEIKAVVQEFGAQLCTIVAQNARAAEVLDRLDNDMYLVSDSVAQQKQSLQTQLAQMQVSIDALPNTEMMQAIRQQLTDQHAAQSAVLDTLLKDTHSVPTLVLMLPDIPSGMDRFNPSRLVQNSYRLFFLCGHTLRIMSCGPDGKGYPLKAPKAWVVRAAPLLKIGLVLVQAGLTVAGLPIPIAGIAHALSKDANASQEVLEFAFDLLPKTDTAAANAVSLTDVNSLDLSMEGSRDAYKAIKEVMSNQDPTLQFTGLTFVTDTHTGKSQWIANDRAVIASFHETHGERYVMPPQTRAALKPSSEKEKSGSGMLGKWRSKN